MIPQITGAFRALFSVKGLVIAALGAIIVAVIGGQAQQLVQTAAAKIKSLKG